MVLSVVITKVRVMMIHEAEWKWEPESSTLTVNTFLTGSTRFCDKLRRYYSFIHSLGREKGGGRPLQGLSRKQQRELAREGREMKSLFSLQMNCHY